MSIDRARHLTGGGTGLTAGSDASLRDKNAQARERRAPADGAAQDFANLMQSGRKGQSEREDDCDGQRHAFPLGMHGGLQGQKQLEQFDKPTQEQAPLPDVFSLFARRAATADPMPAPLDEALATLITSSLFSGSASAGAGDGASADAAGLRGGSASVPIARVTIDALRVHADGRQSIEIDVGSQSPALSGLTVRLAEREGRLQVDFLTRDAWLFERLASEVESIAQKLQRRLTRVVLVSVEQVGGGTSSPVESLAS